jgi:hypothetical protein
MYIFAKFVPDHIFLQNRDKLNIKKFKARHHAAFTDNNTVGRNAACFVLCGWLVG